MKEGDDTMPPTSETQSPAIRVNPAPNHSPSEVGATSDCDFCGHSEGLHSLGYSHGCAYTDGQQICSCKGYISQTSTGALPPNIYGYVVFRGEDGKKYEPKLASDYVLDSEEKQWYQLGERMGVTFDAGSLYRRLISSGEGFEIVPETDVIATSYKEQFAADWQYTLDGIVWDSVRNQLCGNTAARAFRRPIQKATTKSDVIVGGDKTQNLPEFSQISNPFPTDICQCGHSHSVHVQGLLKRYCAICNSDYNCSEKSTTPSPSPQSGVTGLLARIHNYLGNGGLFNSEHMEHDKVRELIIDCREALQRQQQPSLCPNCMQPGYHFIPKPTAEDPSGKSDGEYSCIYKPAEQELQPSTNTQKLREIVKNIRGHLGASGFFDDSVLAVFKRVEPLLQQLEQIPLPDNGTSGWVEFKDRQPTGEEWEYPNEIHAICDGKVYGPISNHYCFKQNTTHWICKHPVPLPQPPQPQQPERGEDEFEKWDKDYGQIDACLKNLSRSIRYNIFLSIEQTIKIAAMKHKEQGK